MNDTLIEILLFAAAGLILLIVLPARRRLRNRSSYIFEEPAQPEPQAEAAPEPERPPAQPRPATAPQKVSPVRNVASEINPCEQFLAKYLKRGQRPTPLEVLRLQKKLERENWPVPEVQEVLEEFDRRREEIARRKMESYLDEAGPGPIITANGQLVEDKAGPQAQPQPPPGQGQGRLSEMKVTTLRALAQLPKQVPPPPYPDPVELAIPLLFDGSAWHCLKLVAGSHWGFFGVTRSGKGNALQHIALNALSFGPELVRLIVLDAKGGLDYGFCEKLSHAALYADREIWDGTNVALDEMDRRKALLKAADCRNHYEYERKTGQKLPLVLIIADEIAEFNDEQHSRIATLARTSGAMGGILMVATQYPVAKVLPTQIQANVGSRLVFRLASSDQIQVAMRRTKEDEGTYNPALITESMKGVAVLRLPGGEEVLGRVPEVGDAIRAEMISELMAEWPRPAVSPTVSRPAFPTLAIDFEFNQSEKEGNTPGKQAGATLEEEEGNGEETLTVEEEEVIAAMLKGGLSKRKIAAHMKGKTKNRLEQINRIEEQLKLREAAGNEQ